jgi:hypothetical protein
VKNKYTYLKKSVNQVGYLTAINARCTVNETLHLINEGHIYCKLRKVMSKKLHSLEAELSALKEERQSFQLKLEEQKGRISLLVQQNKSLQTALDDNKKKEVCSFLLNSSKMIYNYTAAYSRL